MILGRDRLELAGVGARRHRLARGDRDLDRGRKQARTAQQVGGLRCSERADDGRAGGGGALGEQHDRLAGLGVEAVLVGLVVRGSRAVEVAHAPADLAELVEPVGRHRERAEALQLLACAPKVLLCLGPRAPKPRQLGGATRSRAGANAKAAPGGHRTRHGSMISAHGRFRPSDQDGRIWGSRRRRRRLEPRGMSTATVTAADRDELVERLLAGVLGMIDIQMIYVGDRLDLYRALASRDASAQALAQATGCHPRYVREWLEQQAVAGILLVDDAALAPEDRRYRLPGACVEVLTDRDSVAYLAPFARMMVGVARQLPAVLNAFRTGGGVPYADYDLDFCEGQADMNRPMFVNQLASDWLPALPDVHARLRSDPPARVADIACGAGHATLALARAYPAVRVDGFDLDPVSIGLTREQVAHADLGDRITSEVRDAADPTLQGPYDLVMIFEAIHDMPRPVEALSNIRRLLGEGGCVLVADERVADTFTAAGALVGAADVSRDGDGARPCAGRHRGIRHDRPRRRPTPGLVARARGRPAPQAGVRGRLRRRRRHPTPDAPTAVIRVALSELAGGGTQMDITTAWASVEAIEQMLATGMEAGMTAAVAQIDELLGLPARA